MNAKQQREWEDDVTQPCAFPEPLAEVLTRENRELRAEVARARHGLDLAEMDQSATDVQLYVAVRHADFWQARAERAEAELADATTAAQNLRDELQGAQERLRQVRELADDLAGALAIAVLDAHPTYGSTAGWRGGIGGAAMTTACSMIDPPPGQGWLDVGLGLLTDPLRNYLRASEESGSRLDLDAAKAKVEADLRAALDAEP